MGQVLDSIQTIIQPPPQRNVKDTVVAPWAVVSKPNFGGNANPETGVDGVMGESRQVERGTQKKEFERQRKSQHSRMETASGRSIVMRSRPIVATRQGSRLPFNLQPPVVMNPGDFLSDYSMRGAGFF